MGSVGGKTPIKPKLDLFFSLALGTSNYVTVDIMCIHSYNMGDKIRRMRMNMAFEYICQKRVELLNLWKDCPSLHNVSNFTQL